ncbi:uncharacterized protein LOC116246943 [Nymphaea colorata]|nr:uncharacterized protein LOC116246943 [Nymphaea colorata]
MFPFSFPPRILLAILVILLVIDFSASQKDAEPETIYDVLKIHGLPIGLLPKGVSNFSIDAEGNFEVHLDQACNTKFENQVHYEKNISGTLSYGQIGAVSGISAQELFLWFPVKGIRVDVPSSGLIYFDVGVIYKQFSLSLFEIPRECRVVDHDNAPDLLQGKRIADAVLKSTKGKLRYEYDQDVQMAVL